MMCQCRHLPSVKTIAYLLSRNKRRSGVEASERALSGTRCFTSLAIDLSEAAGMLVDPTGAPGSSAAGFDMSEKRFFLGQIRPCALKNARSDRTACR